MLPSVSPFEKDEGLGLFLLYGVLLESYDLSVVFINNYIHCQSYRNQDEMEEDTFFFSNFKT